MIACARTDRHNSESSWHKAFLAMLPTIQQHARIAFRDRDAEAREDAVQEVVANALVAFVRLVELGKTDLAYASVLARFAVKQIHDGRRIGATLNIRDVSSRHCQKSKNVKVQSLHRFDNDETQWREIVVEDKRATPADIVATRVDFEAWLNTLTPRDRRLASAAAIRSSRLAAPGTSRSRNRPIK